MKRISLALFLMAVTVTGIHAQDVITKRNGDEINAKVLEIGVDEVKYKRYNNVSGPTYSLSKSEIFMIKYENGEKDLFEETPDVTRPSAGKTSQPPVRSNAAYSQNANRNQNQRQPPAQTSAPRQAAPAEPVFRRGYVGIGVGAAGLLEEYSDASGGRQVNLNFGCLFSRHVGITATLFNTDFDIDDTYKKSSVGLTGILTGPLFSVATASRRAEFDLRPMIGFAFGSVTVGSKSTNSDETIFSYGIGGSIRWNCSSRFAISANMDYYHGEVFRLDLSSIGLTVGANFRF